MSSLLLLNDVQALGYRPRAVVFDGANDYMARGAVITGAADTQKFTCSFWIYPNANQAQKIFTTNTEISLTIELNASGKLVITGLGSGGTGLFAVTSNTTLSSGAGYHVCFSFDLSNAAKYHLYINGTLDSATPTTYSAVDDIRFSDHTNAYIGEVVSNHLSADIADFYLNAGVYTALSTVSNLRKFITSQGKPVYLGATGNLPTGTAPIVFFSLAKGAAVSTFASNKGTGGGFTLTGTLTESSWVPGA